MVTKFRVSKAAANDLYEIGVYTEEYWGKEQRNNYLDDLESRFIELANDANSALAIPRNDIKWGCFSSNVNKHMIVFRKFKYGIRIIRVLHQSMDIVRQLQ
ncbi:MAG TPA: type II toxin-antitoxin system RelE/ParE family toxin [Alteromonas macleodii]|nr:plasmid stabilization protein ParE [Alteromonas sp.]TAP20644.1 type II toxin-antitoxin system RelE/ParE family toxin [Alteromonas sp. KUL17]HBN99482.1 type II toxin-antitoxin system RelE/ParE family toxin [Alteromonas macleodii]HCS80245.1 type II toxin-antitoxin system RelE/ParE family toxin [Alteromonas macleodii]